MAIVTFQEVASFLELKQSASQNYPNLVFLIDSMQSTFESYTSRLFDLEERTETFRISDEVGQDTFWIKGVPITSVAEVTIDSVAQTGFTFSDNSVRIATIASQGQTVQIRYTGGIIDNSSDMARLATLPNDLRLAAIRQIAFEYQNISRIGVTQVGIEDNARTIPTLDLIQYTRRVLDSYRNWGAGF